MKTQIIGRNIEVTEAMKDITEDKLSKLDKYFQGDAEARVVYSLEGSFYQKVEITVFFPGFRARAEVTSGDIYESLDGAMDILSSQIKKQKSKLKKKYGFSHDSIRFHNMNLDALDEDIEDEEDEARIVKRKSLNLGPMLEDEAILQMELLNHDMFIFLDAEDDVIKVLYKRKDGNYGVISANRLG